jgi:L-threonylcarbamoyladenylate synthase
MQLVKDHFDSIVQDLRDGKVLLMPTDTIWGIVCDAYNTQAVERVLRIKGLKPGAGAVTLVKDMAMLKAHAPMIHPRIETLLVYHTRPLTLLYSDTLHLSTALHASDGTTAIRITFDQLCAQLIDALERPIVAAAACSIGNSYPAHFGEIKSDILTQVDYIMKYRQADRSICVPSVIARMGADEELEFLRE